jgi:hypothetical protein
MNPNDYSDMLMGISAILTLSFAVVFVYGGFKFVNAWSAKKKNPQPGAGPAYDAEAIARLQASVDAISIEVERISEGQRFTTRLMNERMPEQALLPQARDRVSGVSQ